MTNKKYFGTISSKAWYGRNLSLFRLNGRSLSPSLTANKQPNINANGDKSQFAYKMTYSENSDGHELNIFDFQLRKITVKFDPIAEKYRRIPSPADNDNVKFKFNYESIVND